MEDIASQSFDIKDKLSDNEYLNLMNSLMKAKKSGEVTNRTNEAEGDEIFDRLFLGTILEREGEEEILRSLPERPKRPKSAYIFFCTIIRQKIKDENPSISNTELIEIIGNQWKELAYDEKRFYKQLADEDKIRYNEDKIRYNNSRYLPTISG
jgi:hypothetical protein